MTDDKKMVKLPHSIIMEDRKKLSVSGVTDIDSFDEQTIIAITDLGELTIRGWNLHITRLNLEQGELLVDGEISSLTYTDVRPQAKGFFAKLDTGGVNALSEKAKERYLCEENLVRLEKIKKLSEKYGCSIAAAVCACLCSLEMPDVFPIIGGSNIKQIEDSMSGADIVIEKEELKDLFGYNID